MIILITASLSSNTYDKASWWCLREYTQHYPIIDHSLRLLRFWILWGGERTSSLFINTSPCSLWLWFVFPKTVNSTPHTTHFVSVAQRMTRTRVAQVVSLACAHHIPCVIYMGSCCMFWLSSATPLSSLCCLSSLLSSCLSSLPSTSSSKMWWTNFLCTSANEDLGTLAEYDPLTGYEPNDYHISETTEPYNQESSGENGSLNDIEYEDVTIGMALSSPLFTQEREDAASLMTKVCRPVSRHLSVIERGNP